MRHQFFAGAALAALLAPSAVYAQEVSSTIGGTIISKAGTPVSGAKVVIIHVPTGTRATATTSADGQFEARGLRVGGPYTVTISADNFQGQTIQDISMGAGDKFSLNAELETATDGNTIVVTASRLKRSGILTTGSETTVSAIEIASVASASRDLRDVARRDPLTSFDPSNRSLSIGGQQARSNRFTIDGVQVQDDFGLNQGGLPSLRGIVSLEAIGQFSVKTAPFDVSQGNFTGGTLDAVLKSGTNEYHAAGYYQIGGKGLTGRNVRGTLAAQALPFRDWGGFISGPIIKDKLFLALNYERLSESSPIITAGIGGEGAANAVPNIGGTLTSADDRPLIDAIRATFNSRYKYDPLNTFVQAAERDRKISGKLDWNIADGQRLSATYINHFNSVPSPGGGSSNSASAPNLGLQSNSYEATEATKVYTGQLNSKWSDGFSTEVRVSYRDYVRGQVGYNDKGFAEFQICSEPGSVITASGIIPVNTAVNCGLDATVRGGTDTFRHSNALSTNNLNGQFIARFRSGDHRIKLALEASRQRVNNIFVPQSRGIFYFDSVADFNAGTANRVQFTNALTGNPATGAASIFSLNYYSLGLQDEWQITPNLTILGGYRYDIYQEKADDVANNRFFAARYPGLTNTANLNNRASFQPRLGINWKPTDRLKISGGAGIFSGGVPLVLYSNSFANDGTRLNTIDLRRSFNAAGIATGLFTDANNAAANGTALITTVGAAALNNVNGTDLQTNPVVNSYLSTNVGSLANATTNSLDPNFRVNSIWRLNLNTEYKANLGPLGDDWLLRFDVAASLTRSGYVFTDLRAIANGTLPDGRPRYAGIGNSAGNDLRLTNTDRGFGVILALGVSKDWSNGLSFNAAYTRSRIRDVNSNVNNTTANGGYGVVVRDPNNAELGRSSLEIADQGRLEISYRHSFYEDYETNFSIFGSVRAGRPFSYTFSDANTSGRGSVFGTTSGGRYQVYVPSVASLVVPTTAGSFTTQLDPVVQFSGTSVQLQAFKDFILNSPLAAEQGKIASRGTGRNPTFAQVDLHFSQQIPTFVGKSRITVFADMENFLNMLDDKFAFRQFGDAVPVVSVQCLDAGGALVASLATKCSSYRYSSFTAPTIATFQKQSLWTMRLGVRFDF
jgi:Carboxypeptidase regulatory-like domain/TonB dependent receptor